MRLWRAPLGKGCAELLGGGQGAQLGKSGCQKLEDWETVIEVKGSGFVKGIRQSGGLTASPGSHLIHLPVFLVTSTSNLEMRT